MAKHEVTAEMLLDNSLERTCKDWEAMKTENAKVRRELDDCKIELESLKAEMRRRSSPALAAQKERGQNTHDQLIQEFSLFFTKEKGRQLVKSFGQHSTEREVAKGLVSIIFQTAYDECKKLVLEAIWHKLLYLFTLPSPRRQPMAAESSDDLVHCYGRLLHASGLRKPIDPSLIDRIGQKIMAKLQNESAPYLLRDKSKPLGACINDAILISWRIVTATPPLIVSDKNVPEDPISANPNEHDTNIIQPALYRSYNGDVAEPAKTRVGTCRPAANYTRSQDLWQ